MCQVVSTRNLTFSSSFSPSGGETTTIPEAREDDREEPCTEVGDFCCFHLISTAVFGLLKKLGISQMHQSLWGRV